MRTAVIVQARAKSTRLPGKALLPLGKGTVLSEVLDRCAAIPGADVVCCAIPDGNDDDAVAAEAEAVGAQVVRGDERDVLARYLKAARALNADVVLRVTSDCPLIDPALCGEVLAERTRSNADYACNNMPRLFPHGLDCEAFTTSALARADINAATPREREHVTPWLRESNEISRTAVAGPGGAATRYRWTLDYPEDYELLRTLFAKLPNPAPTAWQEILDIVESIPGLTEINRQHHAA